MRKKSASAFIEPLAMIAIIAPPLAIFFRVTCTARDLLNDDKAPVDQIKAKLAALRAAKERTVQELAKARQNLRQVLTLRQEALLVLNGLLD